MFKLTTSLAFATGLLWGSSHVVPSQEDRDEALERLEEKDASGAIEALKRSLAREGKDEETLRTLLVLTLSQSRWSEASQVAQRLASLEVPGLERAALLHLVDTWQDGRRTSEVDEAIAKLVKYRERGEPKEMLKILEDLANRDPENPVWHFALGEIYASEGHKKNAKRAIKHLEIFLERTPIESTREAISSHTPEETVRDIGALRGLEVLSELEELRREALALKLAVINKEPRFTVLDADWLRGNVKSLEKKIARLEYDLKTMRKQLGNRWLSGDDRARIQRGIEETEGERRNMDRQLRELQGYLASLAR